MATKKEIYQEKLKKYFLLWRDGANDAEICKQTCITPAWIKKHNPDILVYCRDTLRELADTALVTSGIADVTPLTEERREQFLEYISLGMNYAKAAGIMGIPLPTILDVWFKQDPSMREAAKYAAELSDIEVLKALKNSATGANARRISKTDHFDKEGKKTGTTVCQEESENAPSVKAAELWLVNRKNWTRDNRTQTEDNRGAILEALDKMAAE